MVLEHVREDFKLTSVVSIARHALAIDEQRVPFKPELWITSENTDSQQVWFPGVHSDIGGGYVERGLANITLQWIVEEAIKSGLNIDQNHLAIYPPNPLALQHDSLNECPIGHTFSWKMIGHGAYLRAVAQTVSDERLDYSVMARYRKMIQIEGQNIKTPYDPPNLTPHLIALKTKIV